MNKRQRKKREKNKIRNVIIGVDFASGEDFTAIPSMIASFIYNRFNIPEEYMNKKEKEHHLQWNEFLKTNCIVIGGNNTEKLVKEEKMKKRLKS